MLVDDIGISFQHPFLESPEALEQFLARWKLGTLPKVAWTHAAHVAVAAYFTFNHSAQSAFEIIKPGIIHFNTCVGTVNTEDSGYHETLTRFWSQMIGNFVRRSHFASRFEAVENAVRAFGDARDRFKLHYSFDVVRDRRARREWVAPDLKQLGDEVPSPGRVRCGNHNV